jgi:hypothetical protein
MIWIMLGNALLIFCLRLVDVSLDKEIDSDGKIVA